MILRKIERWLKKLINIVFGTIIGTLFFYLALGFPEEVAFQRIDAINDLFYFEIILF